MRRIASRTRLVMLAALTAGLTIAMPAVEAGADVVVSFNPVSVPFHEEAAMYCWGYCQSEPGDLGVAPDGAIWFTEIRGNRIGRLDSESLELQEWKIPTDFARPKGIAVAPDGDVWFLERQARQLGHFDPRTETFREYPLEPAFTGGCCQDYGSDIAVGPDGAIWIPHLSTIHRFDPSTKEWTWADVIGDGSG